jgi:site-specific DNA-methyltransferase (adenine-specific)
MNQVIQGDCLTVLPSLPERFARLIYVDPPFNTHKVQRRNHLKTIPDLNGDRVGFKGRRYRSVPLGTKSYRDHYDDYLDFLLSRIEASLRCLTADGSLFVHLDWREAHYVKVALDGLLGRDHFMNEIIWAYDYGGRTRTKWPTKHDTILWYVRDPDDYVFNYEEMDRIPYMAPGLVSKEKAARGKTPTDVWWHTIVPTNGREKTGYPTQKPLGVLERIIKVHSHPGDCVLDFFAGSGTTGEAAGRHHRQFTLIDINSEAVDIMTCRLQQYAPRVCGGVAACA